MLIGMSLSVSGQLRGHPHPFEIEKTVPPLRKGFDADSTNENDCGKAVQ